MRSITYRPCTRPHRQLLAIALVVAGSGLALTRPAAAAPISAVLTGTIIDINGGTSSAIGVDVAGIVGVGDTATVNVSFDPALAVVNSSFGDTVVYRDAILGADASLNGGALTMSYDPAAGASLNFTWVSTSGFSGFNPVDFDGDGTIGSIVGNVVPTSDPVFITDWHPLQFVIEFAPVADNSVVPSMPDIVSARLDWRANGVDSSGQSFGQQSGITVLFSEVSFGSTVPAPATALLLPVGLFGVTAVHRRRRRRTA